MYSRTESLHRLTSERFDLCIIGGGASGAGCALDATLRGLKVALIECDDFAAGTSSRSTKLVHGGVRYLEQAFKNFDFGQLRQVRHGLEERHYVLANAPHLARPLALLTPVFSWWEGFYFSIGLRLYDWFASGKDQLPASRWLSSSEARRRMPGLSPHIHSAVLYYDGQLDDARYCLALAQSAAEAGAVVLNHIEIVDFQKEESGRITSATFRDRLAEPRSPEERSNLELQTALASGEIKLPTSNSRVFLNCTGPAADQIRRRANPALLPRIRPSKGVHAVLPYSTLGSDDAMLIPKTKDGRMVFAIPFQGRLMLGTTDEDYLTPDEEPVLESKEVDFLLETLNPFLAQAVDKDVITAGFGGLRPLVQPNLQHETRHSSRVAPKSLLRDHEIEHDPVSGLFSLLGGKWTTYRLMAQDAVDAVCQQLEIQATCRTADYRLVGAAGFTEDFWKKILAEYALEPEVAQHLARQYGMQAVKVADLMREKAVWGQALATGFPFVQAEVVYAVRREMACTLRDFMARRIRLEILDWQVARSATPVVAAIMAEELGWTPERARQEEQDYLRLVQRFMQAASGSQ